MHLAVFAAVAKARTKMVKHLRRSDRETQWKSAVIMRADGHRLAVLIEQIGQVGGESGAAFGDGLADHIHQPGHIVAFGPDLHEFLLFYIQMPLKNFTLKIQTLQFLRF